MDIEIKYKSSNTCAKILLKKDDTIDVEPGAMVAMGGDIKVETALGLSMRKGKKKDFFAGIRRATAGESLALNHYTARSDSELWLSPALSGDMMEHELAKNESIVVQRGSFVATESSVSLDFWTEGFRNFLSGEHFIWIKFTGPGKVILNSYGCIYEVMADQGHIVDTGHVVAFENHLKYKTSKAGSSWLSSYLGGEGFVCKFMGSGKIWCQSHHAKRFGKMLTPHLKPKS